MNSKDPNCFVRVYDLPLKSSETSPRSDYLKSPNKKSTLQWVYQYNSNKILILNKPNTLTLQKCVSIPPFDFQHTHILTHLTKKTLTFPSSSSNEAPPPVLQWVTWRTNGMAYLTRRELQVYPFPIDMVPSSRLVFSVVLFASLRKGKKKGESKWVPLWESTWERIVNMYKFQVDGNDSIVSDQRPTNLHPVSTICIARPKRNSESNSIWTSKWLKRCSFVTLSMDYQLHQWNVHSAKNQKLLLKFGPKSGRKKQQEDKLWKNFKKPLFEQPPNN